MHTAAGSVSYKYDFLKYRYVLIGISLAFMITGALAYVVRGGFKYHIDFTGGAELRVTFQKPIETGQLRNFVSNEGWGDASIQSVGKESRSFLVRVGSLESSTEQQIVESLQKGFPDNKAKVDSIQWIGPEVGRDTTRNALIAVLLSMLILLIYIAVRFELRFGVGGVVALAHDVLAVLVFLLLSGEPFSLHVLASVLAVLGYSLNDSIVIFSKIRENLKLHKNASEYDIANLSINQTLTRTLLTSLTTFLSVFAVFLLGGESLRGLSSVMLIGIVFGTYSSIYIASPVMLAFHNKKSKAR
ncbi:MAG: protein translocase subunit SecF [Epsilonproteobacteria bacterium]|nr:protein translocase subunit SecF [Campylobacterota bacterium]